MRLLKALADDVASFVLLQPRRGLLPSAICVANTQFHTSDATPTPHLIQASPSASAEACLRRLSLTCVLS